jgi:molybdate transport system substrate-binding protein
LHVRARVSTVIAGALILAGCSSGQATAPKEEVVVFAAASLSQTFTQLGKDFESDHPGVTVKFSFDGSAALVDQLSAGAAADVLATADTPNMDKAVTAKLINSTPVQFTSNVLTLIVPKGNPAKIIGLDTSLVGKKLVVCADGVPCGSATKKLAQLLGITLHPVSEETKVTDVRTKVESGQADAGIVYVTDAKASGDKVETIAIKDAAKARNAYLIAVPTSAKQAALAAQFIELVTGSRGQEVLQAAGFGQ